MLAPASKLRPRILPKLPPESEAEDEGCDHTQAPLEPAAGVQRVPKGKGCRYWRYWPWRLLKARTFGEPTTACPECGGELRFRALVQDPYVASPELAADMQGFDVSDILDVEDLLPDPVAGSSLA